MRYPKFEYTTYEIINTDMLVAPIENNLDVKLEKGPNIKTLPEIPELKNTYRVPVLLKMGDNISTDEILKAGAEVLPFRSNLPEISKYSFSVIDESFYDRAMEVRDSRGGHIVVAAENYAQGSSREHAALAPKYLGQVAVIAKSYARIAWQNLVNFGILPLEFIKESDYDLIDQGDDVELKDVINSVKSKQPIEVVVHKSDGSKHSFKAQHSVSDRQIEILIKGGIINDFKEKI
jgi:aconitate hydratase